MRIAAKPCNACEDILKDRYARLHQQNRFRHSSSGRHARHIDDVKQDARALIIVRITIVRVASPHVRAPVAPSPNGCR